MSLGFCTARGAGFGAGFGAANGVYTRTGEYRNATGDAAPLFIHEAGQIWLLRYRLPSGTDWWYLADKDQLDRNDGDYYRVRADPEARDVPPLEAGQHWTRGQPLPEALLSLIHI